MESQPPRSWEGRIVPALRPKSNPRKRNAHKKVMWVYATIIALLFFVTGYVAQQQHEEQGTGEVPALMETGSLSPVEPGN